MLLLTCNFINGILSDRKYQDFLYTYDFNKQLLLPGQKAGDSS